jgi:hypothetical protein
MKAQVACAADAVGIALPEAAVLAFIVDMVTKLPDCYNVLEKCEGGGDASDTGDVAAVGAVDPNDKLGGGAGPLGHISGAEPLRYMVRFENLPAASAPAQEVVITDQLDPSKVDVNTFALGAIGFGTTELHPLAGSRSFETDVDLRPAQDLIVRVRASLNMTTGLLTYRFTSIDPLTGLPPTDPLAGFLPPNVTSPEGSGYVLFTVSPKADLPTGTVIRNSARIVFDLNPPIDTPEWVNTIDNTHPVSSVNPLPVSSSDTSVLVQWSGTDEGSGVRDYSVYVSENGGPFALFAANTTATSRVLNGQVGSTYAFYSRARDHAGNIEGAKSLAEATVTIVAGDTTPPSIVPPPDQVVPQSTPTGAPVSYPAPQVTDTGSGVATVACAPASGSAFPVGSTTVTCTATDHAGNSGSASFTVTVTPAVAGRMSGAGFLARSGQHWHAVFRAGYDWLNGLVIWSNDPRRCGRDDHPDDDDHEYDVRPRFGARNWFLATSMTAVFSDDPQSVPGPGAQPAADTVRLSGTGWWNGRPGHTFEAVAVDRGEPGRSRDDLSFVIKDPLGNVVASVTGKLAGGNIQAKRP